MAYSPSLGSTITNTKMRTPENVSQFSGMCAVCTYNCTGTCEIGLSAIRGSEAIYPYKTDINQFASEKDYPLDLSHFNINGRVFGAVGIEEDADKATFPNVNVKANLGIKNKVELEAPIILPAIAKLDWRDYFAGAALAGIGVIIGEDGIPKDENLVLENGKVVSSPLVEDMVNTFRKYYRGYGEIGLQGNFDDEGMGVLDYAITKLGVKTVELKFGQGAKGIQGMGIVKELEEALKQQQKGYYINPDPSDSKVAEDYKKGIGPFFEKIGRIPMWNEEALLQRIEELRNLGAERILFKVGPFDPRDLVTILKIASKAEVDLVTFDGAGGGTGNSPSKMMNEWGIPTVYMESIIYKTLKKLEEKGYPLPQIAIAGGIVTEDHVFKTLSMGAPYVGLVGIGRGAMAAGMSGKTVGELLRQGKAVKGYERFGNTVEEVFTGYRQLKAYYGNDAKDIPTGAVGVYSYIHRVVTGLKQLMTLNRKFALEYIERDDIIPLTELAAKVTGLKTYDEILNEELKNL
ncbi:MAG: glutamate synthase-related protein [Tissierellaceae bacterium]|nr:glutamate synthase-related protein [Tissierellaceae bacterium]